MFKIKAVTKIFWIRCSMDQPLRFRVCGIVVYPKVMSMQENETIPLGNSSLLIPAIQCLLVPCVLKQKLYAIIEQNKLLFFVL